MAGGPHVWHTLESMKLILLLLKLSLLYLVFFFLLDAGCHQLQNWKIWNSEGQSFVRDLHCMLFYIFSAQHTDPYFIRS